MLEIPITLDNSIIKSASTLAPKLNANQELESVCHLLSKTKINIDKAGGYILSLRDGLISLIQKNKTKRN